MIARILLSVSIGLCALATYAAESSSPATAEPERPSDMRRLARRIEPDLVGKAERLPQYIHFFSRELANDSRICAFDVAAEAADSRHVKLTGFVEFPETRSALNAFLTSLGFEVDDELEALPAASLGNAIFGIV